MAIASPITSQPAGKTFTIAISILGFVAVAQLGAVSWAFMMRFHAQSRIAESSAASASLPTMARLTTPSPDLDLSIDPFAEPPPAATGTPGLQRPVPLVPQVPKPLDNAASGRFSELLEQGKMLRERGDTGNALTRLREAQAMNPRSPAVLFEIAVTYDKMGLADRAAEQWKRIYDLGETGGVYFAAAEAKLKASQAHAMMKSTPQTSGATDMSEIEGVAAGATLGLLRVTAEELRDPVSAKKFLLRIPVKSRPFSKVDVSALVIHVLFYDIVDNQNVVQTSANVNSRWKAPPADWADAETEELQVEYQLPALKGENRKYFGYIVRVYYKEQLQAAAAEPERLAQQYPPPRTLQKEAEK